MLSGVVFCLAMPRFYAIMEAGEVLEREASLRGKRVELEDFGLYLCSGSAVRKNPFF